MPEEIWKPIKGYENEYQISNFGNVKSKSRNGTTNKEEWNLIGRFEKQDGYEKVHLSKNDTMKTFQLHRLVAETFIEKPELQVNHKNGIKNDNRVSNLEWVTMSENIKHSYKELNRKCAVKGKTLSEEAKQRISKANKGRKGYSSVYILITINGIEYKGIRTAARELNITRSVLYHRIKCGIFEFNHNGIHYSINPDVINVKE